MKGTSELIPVSLQSNLEGTFAFDTVAISNELLFF